jgi:hypothetical protein
MAPGLSELGADAWARSRRSWLLPTTLHYGSVHHFGDSGSVCRVRDVFHCSSQMRQKACARAFSPFGKFGHVLPARVESADGHHRAYSGSP